MLLHRVHPWIEGTDPTEPYGALFVPPGQGSGRWDNPDLYTVRYLSTSPEGAIAETFGALAAWSPAMLRVPSHPDAVRALSTYEMPDTLRLADLDDPAQLVELGIPRVTDVVARNTRRTQRLAARIHERGTWDGISWWSFYHPSITLVATWRTEDIELRETSALDVGDAAVQDAARRLVREIR